MGGVKDGWIVSSSVSIFFSGSSSSESERLSSTGGVAVGGVVGGSMMSSLFSASLIGSSSSEAEESLSPGGMFWAGIGLRELGIGLIELGIGLMELGIGLRINNARRTVLARVSGLVLNFANFDHSQSCTGPVKPLIFFASFPLFVEIYFKKRGHLSILPIFLPVLGHLLLKLSLLLIGEHPFQHDKHKEWKYIKKLRQRCVYMNKNEIFLIFMDFFLAHLSLSGHNF